MAKKLFFNIFCAVLTVFLFSFSAPVSFAQEQNLSLLVRSQYFDIYSYPGLDVYSLLQELNYSQFRPEFVLDDENDDLKVMLGKAIDSIYLETSDILDIHIYSFKGNLKFLDSSGSLSLAFYKDAQCSIVEPSVYLHDNKTIYISAVDMTLGMLGHEMAHAIISHYFVVPPSTKVQEVLAGYVDYTLKKKSQMMIP